MTAHAVTIESRERSFETALAAVERRCETLAPEDLLQVVTREVFPGRVAQVSSFGAESAVLLHMTAQIDPGLPVIFLDTGKLFGETLRYRDTLIGQLGLTDVRSIAPEPSHIDRDDPKGALWLHNPNRCCHIRKVLPLERALNGFDAWITGRKRFQGASRESLRKIEYVDGRVKVNPLADWTREDLEAYRIAHGLPEHPLVPDGFLSIGCMPCTDRVAPGEDVRAGRWRGTDKTECGIHLPAGGTEDWEI